MKLNPYFPFEATNSLTCFLINSCYRNNSTNFYYSVYYLAKLLLEYSIVPCGFDIRP